ncbi:acetyltransferase [Bacillus sp. CRN 9]|nr:acetyltransferase [Bacillus sp. CRN 9]
MKKILVIGAGGHSRVVQDIINEIGGYQVTAILDDKFQFKESREGVYFGPISMLNDLVAEFDCKIIVAIGQNEMRLKVISQLKLHADRYETVIHPTAIVSKDVSIGQGTVIMANVVVNTGSKIGSHVILNTSAVIDHDALIDDYAHIAPNATLTGAVTVGVGSLIGAGSTVLPTTAIGQWSIIGAGSTVIKNVSSNITVAGSPARIIRKGRVSCG